MQKTDNNQQAAREWLDTSERLPPRTYEIVLWSNGDNVEVTASRNVHDYPWAYPYWMPLPSPPRPTQERDE